MGPPDRPKRESLSAQREGDPVGPPGGPNTSASSVSEEVVQ